MEQQQQHDSNKSEGSPYVNANSNGSECPQYFPFLEARLLPGASTFSPFFMASPISRDSNTVTPLCPATFPWLPHLASFWNAAQSRKNSPSVVLDPSPLTTNLENTISSKPPSDTSNVGSSTPVKSHLDGFSPLPCSGPHVYPYMDPVIAVAALEASPAISRAIASSMPRRPRSEKRPIPDEQKDDKYYERRKRNNLAAKKSRDARKAREDEIALRACFLEKENAILRAQVATLREESQSLRQLLLQKRHQEWCKT